MHIPLKYFWGGFAGALIALVLFAFCSFKPADDLDKTTSSNFNAPSVHIPTSVSFADTTITLNRYDLRERFDREMLAFVYQHSLTIVTIKRANKYFPLIDSVLKRNGVPNDFKYLALIESSLNVRSVSPVKAAGLWQLMPETAKEFGLEVSDDVDERYHVQKSTEAACRYFNKAHAKFGSWLAVAASYNSGMGRIKTELDKQQTSEPLDLLLPEETSRYMFRVLAAKELLKDPKKYGFLLKKEDMYQTINCKDVAINTPVPDWTVFAKQYGITYAELKDFNVWLRNPSLLNKEGKTYVVKIPNKDELNFDINKVVVYQKNWVVE